MKRFLKNTGARIQDIFEYLQSLPEHQRMMLAVATMGLAVVTVYGTWFSAASPLANLDLDTANSPKSEDQTPVSAPPVSPAFAADSPASGIIESFKDMETAFLPRANERKFPSVLTAAASWSTSATWWRIGKRALTRWRLRRGHEPRRSRWPHGMASPGFTTRPSNCWMIRPSRCSILRCRPMPRFP